MNAAERGFTIVELLIVIVVIAILAAISTAAYANISSHAHDSAVQSDIRNFAMKVREQQVLTGSYPLPTHPSAGTVSNGQPPAGIAEFSFTKGSYDRTAENIYYCVGSIDGQQHFGVAAISKSGKRWMQHSLLGNGEYPGSETWGTASSVCNGSNGMRFGENSEPRMFTTAIGPPPSGSTEGNWKPWASK